MPAATEPIASMKNPELHQVTLENFACGNLRQTIGHITSLKQTLRAPSTNSAMAVSPHATPNLGSVDWLLKWVPLKMMYAACRVSEVW